MKHRAVLMSSLGLSAVACGGAAALKEDSAAEIAGIMAERSVMGWNFNNSLWAATAESLPVSQVPTTR